MEFPIYIKKKNLIFKRGTEMRLPFYIKKKNSCLKVEEGGFTTEIYKILSNTFKFYTKNDFTYQEVLAITYDPTEYEKYESSITDTVNNVTYKKYQNYELEIYKDYFIILYLDTSDSTLNFRFKRVNKKIQDIYPGNKLQPSTELNFKKMLHLFCLERISENITEYWYNTKQDSYIKTGNDSYTGKDSKININFYEYFPIYYKYLKPITKKQYDSRNKG